MIARIVKIRAGILITLKPMVLRSILEVLAVSLITMACALLCVVGAGFITARLARRLPVMSFVDPGRYGSRYWGWCW